MHLINITIIFSALLIGVLISQIIFKKLKFFDFEKIKKKSENLILKAKDEAETILEEAKKNEQEIKKNTKEMADQMETLINTITKNVKFKEEILERKINKNKKYQEIIKKIEAEINAAEKEQKEKEKLIKEKIAARLGLSIEELAAKLINDFNRNLKEEANERTAKLIDNIYENAEKTAKNIIKGALQKFTDKTSVEKKEAKIIVPRDEVKALIVGPDAKNILKFEEILDVDVIFNDEPNTIVVSSFDLLKKNIARIALEKLVRLKRIDEKIIEDTIDSAKKILSKDLMAVGEKAIKKMGFKRKFHPDLIKIIGRLKYRTSYGQNILLHSFEVAYMAELLASELGLNTEIAKIAAFFHDIGKAIDQHVEGLMMCSHVKL
jgi:ribonuclease Y